MIFSSCLASVHLAVSASWEVQAAVRQPGASTCAGAVEGHELDGGPGSAHLGSLLLHRHLPLGLLPRLSQPGSAGPAPRCRLPQLHHAPAASRYTSAAYTVIAAMRASTSAAACCHSASAFCKLSNSAVTAMLLCCVRQLILGNQLRSLLMSCPPSSMKDLGPPPECIVCECSTLAHPPLHIHITCDSLLTEEKGMLWSVD